LVLALALSFYSLHYGFNVAFLQILTDFNIVKT